MDSAKITITLWRDEKETAISDVDFKNEDEIIIMTETGNEICISRDEQGDTYVTIDNHELWDNSYREED